MLLSQPNCPQSNNTQSRPFTFYSFEIALVTKYKNIKKMIVCETPSFGRVPKQFGMLVFFDHNTFNYYKCYAQFRMVV